MGSDVWLSTAEDEDRAFVFSVSLADGASPSGITTVTWHAHSSKASKEAQNAKQILFIVPPSISGNRKGFKEDIRAADLAEARICIFDGIADLGHIPQQVKEVA